MVGSCQTIRQYLRSIRMYVRTSGYSFIRTEWQSSRPTSQVPLLRRLLFCGFGNFCVVWTSVQIAQHLMFLDSLEFDATSRIQFACDLWASRNLQMHKPRVRACEGSIKFVSTRRKRVTILESAVELVSQNGRNRALADLSLIHFET